MSKPNATAIILPNHGFCSINDFSIICLLDDVLNYNYLKTNSKLI